jgi:hypothetical protein
MGNGVTRQPIHGRDSLVTGAVPDRSPGPLGWQDAADPDEPMCIAGDTPGPVGTGWDLSSHMSIESQAPAIEVPVLEVCLEKVERFLYTVGLAEAQDFFAKRSFGSAEVQLGRPTDVEARARMSAGRLMIEFQQVLPLGPVAIHGFLKTQQQLKDKAVESLERKFAGASSAGGTQREILGGVVKFLSVVRFTSTVTVKVAGLFAPGAGDLVDIGNDVALAGIDAYFAENKKIGAVVVAQAGKSGGEWMAEQINEAVAEGFISRKEGALMEETFKKFRGDQSELLRQIEKIEKRLEAAAQGSKTARKAARQYVKKLDKLRTLRKKAFKGGMKKTAGKVLTLVFLAEDLKEAWGTMSDAWARSN